MLKISSIPSISWQLEVRECELFFKVIILMNKVILILVCTWEALSASTSPLISSVGDSFKSVEVTISISGGNANYDVNLPFSSAFSSNSIGLVLSMINYNQSFNGGYCIQYFLYENTPSQSTSTYVSFRVFLGLSSYTSSVRVKYCACPTSILSPSFNILPFEVSPGSMSPNSFFYYTFSTSINTG